MRPHSGLMRPQLTVLGSLHQVEVSMYGRTGMISLRGSPMRVVYPSWMSGAPAPPRYSCRREVIALGGLRFLVAALQK
uniref:Uncharacterized protein n=1 Tax=uncultured marine group II/III euryarchaeote KM3_82_C12 TaxID=1456518 RepID=A0A075HWZ0_9EURY|nr:hypothetical protein [uncultured marine group II/III euryarchaeote KM3_82_C12]